MGTIFLSRMRYTVRIYTEVTCPEGEKLFFLKSLITQIKIFLTRNMETLHRCGQTVRH